MLRSSSMRVQNRRETTKPCRAYRYFCHGHSRYSSSYRRANIAVRSGHRSSEMRMCSECWPAGQQCIAGNLEIQHKGEQAQRPHHCSARTAAFEVAELSLCIFCLFREGCILWPLPFPILILIYFKPLQRTDFAMATFQTSC
jgi:hypothetical protein